MKILSVKSLSIPDVKVIKFARFCDDRGYFTETFRKSDLFNHPDLPSMKNLSFLQANQSFSKKGVIRGLHFQWNPYMGKLVKTTKGHMVDLFLDIRKGSPTFGKISAYDMPTSNENDYDEWIWVPVGFAHGNYFKEDSIIEYFCSGEYSPDCEAGIGPLSSDLDWSLCPENLKHGFDDNFASCIISAKDRDGMTLNDWTKDERSDNFIYDELKEQGLF
ncbi:MAG: dTDP-4-dehydrorhamnose 3,5-epimerase-like enzyme [Methanobacterium sp. Maddingley MBC34]|nr:MAG: dTDP-4-dehydrorhamnose 3,5-epimerase-like enzyme [Methanobacterium sp. Maddingley MBC34]